MASIVLRGVTIRYADLRFEKEGAVFSFRVLVEARGDRSLRCQ